MYETLFKRSKQQDPRTIFADFKFRPDLGENWETPFQKLADKAKNEDWNFHLLEYKNSSTNYPILTSYLNFTFIRLQQQNKIKFNEDQSKACINTGLQTPEEKDIFATFYKNLNAEKRGLPDWTLYGYFDTYSEKVRDFEPLPDIATYIDDPSELVFDHSYEFDVQHKHICSHNKDRLPEILKSSDALARKAVEGAILQLKKRLRRNYKLAIPHWYDGRIQLLLPLTIEDDNITDLVLVAEKDFKRRKYMIRTSLKLDDAYLDARVVCAPDRQWLNP